MRRKIVSVAVVVALGAAGAAAYIAAPSHHPVTPAASATAERQRLLPLEGGQNFRDLGGYRTGDGRHVRWGMLYRSGSMHHLTAKDFAYLDRLGIKTVCDLRDNGERAKEPVAWPKEGAPNILTADYSIEGRGLGIPATERPQTAEAARDMMRVQYAKMLPRFAPQYRDMFKELLAGRAPLAFNCSAGKDRTGVASALLLTALGVPRQTVIEDYLLSNRYLDAARAMKAGKGGTGELTTLSDEVLKVFLSVDPAFLEPVFEIMDRHEGGADGYLRDEMGLGSAEIGKLRTMYTE